MNGSQENYFGMLLIAFLVVSPIFPDDWNKGEIIKSVHCIGNPSESYALYLPSDFSPARRWPVIIAFDPAGRGSVPVELFREAAETYGYIVVCSNNSRNGPWEDVIRSMTAVWNDIRKRFSVDTRRVYVTGFSGGARAASIFSQVAGTVPSGIIACGAGLHEKLKPEDLKPSLFYGIVGLEDFNYKEFRRLVPLLDQAGVRYCIDYIEGPHRWPDGKILKRAVEWMTADSLKDSADASGHPLVERLLSGLLKYAGSLRNGYRFYYGALYLERLVMNFFSLIPDKNLKESAEKMIHEKRFIGFAEKDRNILAEEYRMLRYFYEVFERIGEGKGMRTGLTSVLNDLKVPFLKGIAKKKQNFNAFSAGRLLDEIAIKADRHSELSFRKDDQKKAELFAEIAAETGRNRDYYLFRLASLHAAYGNKKKCVRILRTLKKSNPDLIQYIQKDLNFSEFLKDPVFIRQLK